MNGHPSKRADGPQRIARRFALLPVFFLICTIAIATGHLGPQPSASSNKLSTARAADGRYIHWVEHRIDDEELAAGLPLRGADGLAMVDLDRDGFEDILSVHEDRDHIRIAFGTGDPNRWENITLAEGADVAGPEDLALADVDRDGDIDVLIACEGAGLAYFENPGSGVRDPSRWARAYPVAARGRGSWVRAYLADLDQDGRVEAIAPNKSIPMHGGRGSMDVPESAVSWFEIPDDPLDAGGWVEHELARFRVPINSEPIDLDGDGDLDIVVGSRAEQRLVLFENIGRTPLRFREIRIDPRNRNLPTWPPLPKRLSGFMMVYADLNGDGRLDIVTTETPWSVVWLEQPPELEDTWPLHSIASVFPDSPTALTLVDINGDGRLDLFSGGYSEDPREEEVAAPGPFHRAGGLFWFEAPEDPSSPWTRHFLSRRVRGMFDAFLPRDLNTDGLIDFVGTRGNSGAYDGVLWIEQRRSTSPQPTFSQAREDESAQLPPPPKWLRILSDWVLQ